MPKALDLSGSHFGKLIAIRLLKQRDNEGRRVWLCQCECGRKHNVSALSLRTGNTKSCGCLVHSGRCGRPFKSTEARRAHKRKERIFEEGQWWYSPRLASRYVGATQTTLTLWQTRCPWLEGARGIEPRRLRTAYGRLITYYLKRDLDKIWEAKAKRPQVPDYDGLVHVVEAARQCGVSVRTLRRAYGRRPLAKDRPAKSRDGRALPRSYLPCEFVDDFREKRRCSIAADGITVEETARVLKLTVAGVHSLLHQGVLHSKPGRALCRGGYPRPVEILSRSEVDMWRRQQNGEIPPEPYGDKEGIWLPRPLALERYPRITSPMLLKSTNKQHPQTGLTVQAKPIKWPNGFRFPRHPKPLGFLDEDLARLDRSLAKIATEQNERAKMETATAIVEQGQPELTDPLPPLPDGPVEPDKFCWNGVPCSLSRPLEHRLLSLLWIKRRISMEEGICELYGHDADGKEAAFLGVVKRLRKFLLQHSIPFELPIRAAHLIFEPFNSK
jgi:hypothetical protein